MNIQPQEFNFSSHLTILDFSIIIIFILLSIFIGLYFSKRGRKNIGEYFASGGGSPWWLLGTSMVATTFAADTPLAISGLVVKQGIWGNWYWWAQIPIFTGGVFFFARLWKRAKILTDTELVTLRYSGKSARLLRGFRAIYFALPYNCLIMGWVILSMTKIMDISFDIPKHIAVFICVGITVFYSAISGLWGVMITDFFQFFLAISMAIYLAVISVHDLGGMSQVLHKLTLIYGNEQANSMTQLIPPLNAPHHGFAIFLLYITLLWWTVGQTDGGLFFAQRMIAAKNEKHSFLGYLWFNIAHFCLRPWPWIVVGLVAAVKFPGIASRNALTGEITRDPELGYIAVMLTYLKPGLLGLMLASFLAAFMSTVSTQINWGASYLINDFYKPFIKSNASPKHYVRISTLVAVGIALLGGAMSFFMNDIFFAWLLLSAINAGIGIVYIARWYWWRVNAWSEISAIIAILIVISMILLIHSALWLKWTLALMVIAVQAAFIISHAKGGEKIGKKELIVFSSAILSLILILAIELPEKIFPWTLIYSVPISFTIWLTITLLTSPVEESKLIQFYRKVHPGGPGWKTIAEKIGADYSSKSLWSKNNLICAISTIGAVICALLATGSFILHKFTPGSILLSACIVSIVIALRTFRQLNWDEI